MRGETKKRHWVGAARGQLVTEYCPASHVEKVFQGGSVSVWDADEISSKMRTRNGPFDLTTRRSNCDLRRATSMKWKTQKPDWR